MRLPGALTPTARRILPDGLAVLLLLGIGIWFWPRTAGTGGYVNVDVPAWATVHDLLLDGPDAGEWASSAWKLARGEWDQLDVHRLPTFPALVGLLLPVQPDVALAGHLLNHLWMLLLPLLVYGVGRTCGGRAVGWFAALLVVACKPLLLASRVYGVDATITFLLVATFALARLSRRWWWMAGPAGLLAAAAALTHYTTLPYPLAAGAVVALAGPPLAQGRWRRAAAVGLYVACAAAGLFVASRLVPLPNVRTLIQAVSEGIAPASWSARDPTRLSPAAQEILAGGLGSAVESAVSQALQGLRSPWLPWYLGLALPWIGILGPANPSGDDAPSAGGWMRRIVPRLDPGPGVALLLYLVPLPVLAAAGAEPRYGWNLLPFVALLLARGGGLLGTVLDEGIRRAWGRWPRGVLLGVGAIVLAVPSLRALDAVRRPLAPSTSALASRQLGEALARHFPPGGGAVCLDREAAAHAGRSYCPHTGCPFQPNEAGFIGCLRIVDRECPGDGPVPWVAVERDDPDPRTASRQAMDTWMLRIWTPLETVRTGSRVAHVLSIPREEARMVPLGRKADGVDAAEGPAE